jgi:hypothetical protein
MAITAGEDGKNKVIDLQGRILKSIDVGCPLFSVAVTPEPYSQAAGGYESKWFRARRMRLCWIVFTLSEHKLGVISLGGDRLLITTKSGDVRELFTENNCSPIWKLQYTHIGTELFLGCDDGTVRRYVYHEKVSEARYREVLHDAYPT